MFHAKHRAYKKKHHIHKLYNDICNQALSACLMREIRKKILNKKTYYVTCHTTNPNSTKSGTEILRLKTSTNIHVNNTMETQNIHDTWQQR